MKQQTLAVAADQDFEQYRRATKREAWTATAAWLTARWSPPRTCMTSTPFPICCTAMSCVLRVYGDSAYASQQELIAGKAPAAQDCTNQRVRTIDGQPDEAQPYVPSVHRPIALSLLKGGPA